VPLTASAPTRPSAATRLRVALVVDPVIRAYVAEVVEQVRATPAADLVAVAIPARRRGAGPRATHRLYRLYERLDRRVFAPADDALARARLEPPDDVPFVEVDAGDGTDPAAWSPLRALDLDVVVDLRAVADPPVPTDLARFGIWRLDQGLAGRAPLLTEVAAGSPTSAQSLTAAVDGETRRVIDQTVTPTVPYSLDRTRQAAYWKSANLVVRGLERVAVGGWDAVATPEPSGEAVASAVGPRHDAAVPGELEMVTIGAKIASRAGRVVLRRLTLEHEWFVARRRVPASGPTLPSDLSGFEIIRAPAGHFYADPFLIEVDGRHHLFVEDYTFANKRAAISTLELRPDGTIGPPVVVLDRPYHLSYPFVFRHDGELYLVPEAKGSARVQLYRAVQFPDQWELASIVADFPAADPTILVRDGRLWLFVTRALRGTNPWDELFLYHADDLAGPWIPHPRNPVVSDVRSARPAGRVFERDGVLYRPAQDCSRAYGWRISWNRIEVLSTTEYREAPVATTQPTGVPNVERTHCYDTDGTFEVLDGLRWHPRRPRRRVVPAEP
jgi:hypothetical protein